MIPPFIMFVVLFILHIYNNTQLVICKGLNSKILNYLRKKKQGVHYVEGQVS